MFAGASLILGAPIGPSITAIHLPILDLFIRREEKTVRKKIWGRMVAVQEKGAQMDRD